jgi:hypothetical protein
MCCCACWLALKRRMRQKNPSTMTLYYKYPNLSPYNPDAYSTSQLGLPDVARLL